MNQSTIDMIVAAIEEGSRMIVFLFLLAWGIVGSLLLLCLFASLALRRTWLWLTRGSLNSVVVSAERKALR